MNLLDLFRRKPQRTVPSCPRKEAANAPSDAAAGEQLKSLQSCRAAIVDISRLASGPDRTLTVLFYNDSIGYFCIQQCSGAYCGLAFRYLILPRGLARPQAENYIDSADYSAWISGKWFSEAFELDIYGKKCLEAIRLPQGLYGMRFEIVLKKPGCSAGGGCILERFVLHKEPYEKVKLSWSAGFGFQMGAHNPGAGGTDDVPSEFFLNHDLSGFAAYISGKYKDFASYDDIWYNGEVQTLFDLCAELK